MGARRSGWFRSPMAACEWCGRALTIGESCLCDRTGRAADVAEAVRGLTPEQLRERNERDFAAVFRESVARELMAWWMALRRFR